MASDHFKGRKHEKHDKRKYMEHHFSCALREPESIMKFSHQSLESPPPKPPRRRYSDQLSVSSLGNYSSTKSNEENQINDLKIDRCNPKPAYLSLPANLTSDVVTECDDIPKLHLDSHSVADHLKNLRENDFFVKHFLHNLQSSESSFKQAYESNNKFFNKEKLPSVIHGIKTDHMPSKYQYENVTSCSIDKLSRNSLGSSKAFMTSTNINQNIKSFHKECHRRHHSDPAISLHSDNSMKLDYRQYCESSTLSSEKINNYCDSTGCLCCKKSSFIMQEIRILKEINEKLWQHLCCLQTYLESMKKNVYDECSDISVSGLLSSIYYAQKAKDIAMEERLKITLEERNAAINELENVIHILTKSYAYSDSEKVDMNFDEVLDEIGCSMNPSKFLKHQKILLGQIHSFKTTKHDGLSQKLREVMIERDNALEKVKKLEEDIKELKLSYGLWHSDNKLWETTMLDILSQVMHQRDTVLSKIDNGFDISNAIYRQPVVSKFDPTEHPNLSPYESKSKTIESIKSRHSVHLIDFKQQYAMNTTDENIKLKEEILLVNKALEGERKKREQIEGKCLKLERLIHILRKKLNGQNIGVPV